MTDQREPERISGLKMVFDKTPPKWTGSIHLKSQYAGLSEYVTSNKDSCGEAIADILSEYKHRKILGIDLKRTKDAHS